MKTAKIKRVHTNRGVYEVRTKNSASLWLEELRESLSMNKKEFADFIGTTPQNYTHISTGKAYPTFQNLSILLARGFNVAGLLSTTAGN